MPRKPLGRTASDTHALYVRCSSKDAAAVQRTARRAGYHSTAEWLRVLIKAELERQRILFGKLKKSSYGKGSS